MSIKAIARVLEDAKSKGNDRLVLIALADYANDDGTGVYPSIPKIASKANCEDRTVIRCLKNLVRDGQIEEAGRTPKGTRAWKVLTGLTPDRMSPVTNRTTRDKHDTGPMTNTTPTPDKHDIPLMDEPSIEPSGEPKQFAASPQSSGKGRKAAPRDTFKPDDEDPVDAVIVEIFEHWAKGTGDEKARLTQHRASKIRARLREKGKLHEGGKEVALAEARREILFAVDGMIHSKWHRENGQLDFLLMFRDEDRIVFFANKRKAQVGQEQAKPSANGEYAEYAGVVERG